VDEAEVRGALGVADRTILHRVTDAILRRDPAPCLQAVEELYRYGYEVPRFCRDLVEQLRHLTVAALFHDPAMLGELPDQEVQETLRQAGLRPPEDLQRLFRIGHAGAEEVRKSLLPKLVLEMTLVKMATMPDAAPVDELVGRLEEMERRLRGGDPPAGRGPGPETSGRRAPAGARVPVGAGAAGARATADDALGPRAATAGDAPGPRAAAAPAITTASPAPAPAARVEPRPAAVAAARAQGAPSAAGALAATGAASATASAARVMASTADAAPSGGGWTAFLAAAQAKVSLRMCLNGSRALAEGPDLLHVVVESEFAERALRQRDNMAQLEEIAARCYGGAPRIEVSVVQASSEDVAARKAAEAARQRELDARARSSPTVRSAVEILGGEITDVRPRGRGGES
jgi:DNA polymerase III gamma/tau subunit